MKPRTLIILVSLTACGLSVAGVVWQARQIEGLREESERLREQLKHLPRERFTSAGLVGTPATHSPSPELLRLRNQVSQLLRRQQELTGVPRENERLRGQIASARTNVARALPPGYIRKSEARNLGYSRPEATLETILWAIRNRDFTNFLNAFTPEMAEKFRANVERDNRSPEEFFKEAEAFVGFNVVERVEESNGVTALKVGLLPNGDVPPEPMRFRLLNGEWKADWR